MLTMKASARAGFLRRGPVRRCAHSPASSARAGSHLPRSDRAHCESGTDSTASVAGSTCEQAMPAAQARNCQPQPVSPVAGDQPADPPAGCGAVHRHHVTASVSRARRSRSHHRQPCWRSASTHRPALSPPQPATGSTAGSVLWSAATAPPLTRGRRTDANAPSAARTTASAAQCRASTCVTLPADAPAPMMERMKAITEPVVGHREAGAWCPDRRAASAVPIHHRST